MIGPLFSHNTGYGCATTDLLIQFWFIHCDIMSPFILHCFAFSLAGEWKVRNHWRGVDKLYGLYLLRHANGQMHVYLIASSIKIITQCNIFAMYRFKSASMVSSWDLRIYVFLGCDLPIQLLLKSLSIVCDDRLVDHFHHVLTTKYVAFTPVIYQYSCFFV